MMVLFPKLAKKELCQSGVMKGVIIQPQSERKTLSMFFRVHHVCWVLSSKFMNISISGQEGLSPCFFKGPLAGADGSLELLDFEKKSIKYKL